MTKNLQCNLERTERVFASMKTEIFSLKEKISTCAEENAKTEAELKNVQKTVKYQQNILLKYQFKTSKTFYTKLFFCRFFVNS